MRTIRITVDAPVSTLDWNAYCHLAPFRSLLAGGKGVDAEAPSHELSTNPPAASLDRRLGCRCGDPVRNHRLRPESPRSIEVAARRFDGGLTNRAAGAGRRWQIAR